MLTKENLGTPAERLKEKMEKLHLHGNLCQTPTLAHSCGSLIREYQMVKEKLVEVLVEVICEQQPMKMLSLRSVWLLML